jgi:hypothetical protein
MKLLRLLMLVLFLLAFYSESNPSKACDSNCPSATCRSGSCDVAFVYCALTCEGDKECIREVGSCQQDPGQFCVCGMCVVPGYCD